MNREERLALKKIEYEGRVYPSNRYGDFIVLEYKTSNNVKIKFITTGYTDTTTISQVHTGNVRDHMSPMILGKGILGTKLTTEDYKQKSYKNWYRILVRCYNENLRNKHPSYLGCTVSEFFLTYTNFRDWYITQKNCDNPDFVLDKDLLSSKDRKIYSENTCVFIPKEINSFLTTTKASRGDLPIGVCQPQKGRGGFRACICKNGRNIELGVFNNKEDAFRAYKTAREAYLKEKAEKWKDNVDVKVYDALMKYEVNIDD